MTRQRLAILGATGSIGVSTLDVVARHPDRYEVFGLTAQRRVDELLAQCLRFRPRLAVVPDDAAAARLAQYQLAAGTYTLRIEGAESVELVVHGPIGGDHQHGADGGHQHDDMDGGVHEHGDAGHEHADDAGHHHADDAGHHHADDAGHEHADDAGHHHEGDGGHEHPPVPDGGASADPAVNAYCLCMLAACHDPFHDRWGVSDEDALAGCAAEAGALAPGTEGDATGDTLACRITACDAADLNGDQATCPAALGGDACQ